VTLISSNKTEEGWPIVLISRHPGDAHFIARVDNGKVYGSGSNCTEYVVVTLNSTNKVLHVRSFINCSEAAGSELGGAAVLPEDVGAPWDALRDIWLNFTSILDDLESRVSDLEDISNNATSVNQT
jgi:hypothetical protein